MNANFVHNALKSLKSNKAVGLDKLSARLLKDASDVIAPILSGSINNLSLMEYFQGSGSVQKSLHYLKMEISH